MKTIILSVLLIIATSSFSQNNEELIYSFKTEKGKLMTLSLDTTKNIFYYRYGTKNKIELEKVDNLNDNSVVFKYSFYFRGGMGNAGLDLNYISFQNKNFTYTIYDEYSAEDDGRDVGIRLKNNNTGKKYDIPALTKSIKGNLSVFRDNELLPIIEDE